MKKPQRRQEHFYSQTQEMEITLSNKPVNTIKRIKRTQKPICKKRKIQKEIEPSPIKQLYFLSSDAHLEIEPSPFSTKYATLTKYNAETNTNKMHSSRKLNFNNDQI